MGTVNTIWLVRDPSSYSELEDICWEQKVNLLDRYVLGSPSGAWTTERHTMYVSREEAEIDANERLAARERSVSTQRTWEEQVREAGQAALAGGPAPLTESVRMRAELARRLERAHEWAVAEADDLLACAQRALRRLHEDGIGAVLSGNDFLGRAQALREAVASLEASREMFSVSLRIQKVAEKEGKS